MSETKKKKAALIVILILVLLLLLSAVGVGIWAILRYGGSYHPIPIVTRPDSYTLPDYPPLDSEPPSTSPDTSPDTAPDTSPDTAPDTSPDSSPDTDPPAVTDPPVTTGPSEQQTLPKDEPSGDHYPIYGQMPIYKVERKDPNVINVLLLGTDSLNLQTDRGRTDTMIVVSYHKVSGEVKLVSLLRDGLVPIEGYDWNRLNAAYVFGGVGLAINTVNQLLDLDIQHFVLLDVKGAKEAVGMIGPITVPITKEEADFHEQTWGYRLSVGTSKLEGEQILNHFTLYHLDNDIQRSRRQRQVLSAAGRAVLENNSLPQILSLVDRGLTLVKTNMDLPLLTSLATSVFSHRNDLKIDTAALPAEGNYRYGWYKGMCILSFDIERAREELDAFLYGNG